MLLSTLSDTITATQSTLNVMPGDGALFPQNQTFLIQIEDEILYVYSISTDTLAVSRGQDGTTAAAHLVNEPVHTIIGDSHITALNQYVDTLGGIAVDTGGGAVDNEYAKFTDLNTLEGRSYAETLSDLSGQAAADFNLPVNIALTFGDGGEQIENNNTDLTVTSGGAINLTAATDVVIPANVGVTFGTGEKIEGDSTDLTVTSGGAINLTATTDVVIPANVGVTFGTGEKIEGDSTDLTVTSGGAINLTATTDVVIPANVGITFGTGEKIEGDSTDLTITSGADIALTATADINIPANVGLTFGDDGEKIEGDGTDLTIASGGKLNLNPTGNLESTKQGITDNHVLTVDDASAADNDYAKFTANGIEGVAYATVLSDIGAATTATAIQAVEDTGLVMTDGKAIEFDPTPGTDHTANGVIVTMTAGASLVFGDACYVGTDGKMEKALADDAAITIPATHLCIATIAENSAGLFLVKGWAKDASWSFDVGKSVYLSAATAGLITKTMPSKVTGNQVQVLGTAIASDTIEWSPSPIVMEYA